MSIIIIILVTFHVSYKLANGTLPLYDRCIIVCNNYINMKVEQKNYYYYRG